MLLPSLLSLLLLTACDWPAFHGTQGDNISTETGLLEQWTGPEQLPKRLWKITLPRNAEEVERNESGYSSPSIIGNRIVFSGNSNGLSTVFCCDGNGNLLWSYSNGPAWTEMFAGTRGTPTLSDGYVYDESPLGNLVCLELSTGQKIWSRNLMSEFQEDVPLYGKSGSLLIHGQNLYVPIGGTTTALIAVDKRTGKTVWRSPPTGEKTGYGTPIFFQWISESESDPLPIVALMESKGLLGLHAETGRSLFRYPFPARLDENISTPIHSDGCLFLTNGAGSDSVLLRLANGSGEKEITLSELWRNRSFANAHGGVVLLDGRLYGFTNKRGGAWACVRWSDGETVFLDREIVRGSCTVAQGLFYILTEFGEVVLAAPTDTGFEIRGRFSLGRDDDPNNGQIYAHPVVCGKRLFVRSGANVYCFDLDKGKTQ